ncbi:MAG TPA: Gfo/Idh/MocA family oxidoreductase [Thermoleophilaceae bacterium]|nr:Gfo/Idh/MocA family oxidoreductase [Thermoleophilaceae bacterium]
MGLRLALLSTARINKALAEGARLADGVEVVAIGSRDRARAEAQARELGVERAHGSYEALLEDPEVDAVYVSLPNSMHVEWSIRALEAGKHVLCEKPMARDPEQVERAFAVAEGAGRVLTEAFMWRHHPQARRLAELVPRVGELRLVRSAFSFPLGDPTDVRLSAGLEGGALMDVGCYCVSGARLVAGEPEEVAGYGVVGGDGVDVRFSGVMRFPGHVLAHFACGMDMAAGHSLEVIGSDGSLFVADPWHSRTPGIELRDAQGAVTEQVQVDEADPYACELADLVDAVEGKRAPLLGREDALAQARTIAALYEAAASGQSVRV